MAAHSHFQRGSSHLKFNLLNNFCLSLYNMSNAQDKNQPEALDVEEKGHSDHLEKHDTHIFSAVDETGTHKKIDPAEIKLVKKLDWIILPILWIMYWFNYLDRNAITVARLDGLEKELNLTSTEYQTCVSILFVGYILGQIPSSKQAPFRYPSPSAD